MPPRTVGVISSGRRDRESDEIGTARGRSVRRPHLTSMKKLVHPVDVAEYRKSDGVSQSSLKWMEWSPAHFLYHATHPTEPTPAMNLGTLIDALLFKQPLKFAVSPFDEFRTKEAKEWRANVESGGGIVFTAERFQHAKNLVEAVNNRSVCREILEDGRAQVGMWAELPTSDPDIPPIQCRGLADWLSNTHACVADFKSTEDASPEAFGKHLIGMGYDMQAAMYLDLLAANGEDRLDWIWIVGEVNPPHEVAVYKAPENLIQRGRAKYQRYLGLLGRSLASGEWPGYPDEIQLALCPEWALR